MLAAIGAALLPLFDIPIVGAILAGIIGLFSVSFLGIFFPSVKTITLGVILLVAAYFIPDVVIIESRRLKLTLRNILGISAVLCFFTLFFHISLPSFGAGTIQQFASVLPSGSMTDSIKSSLTSILPANIVPASAVAIALVFFFTIASVAIIQKALKRRRR